MREQKNHRAVAAAISAIVAGAGLFAGVGPAEAATGVTAAVADNTLTITGDAAANKITLRPSSGLGNIQIDVDSNNSTDFRFERNTFNAIMLDGGGGDDELRIDETAGVFTIAERTTIAGGAGNDRLLGGAGAETFRGQGGNDFVDAGRGNDRAFMGSGDDVFVWLPGQGSDTVDGNVGADTLDFLGAGVNEGFTITPNGPNQFTLFRDVGAITMAMTGTEAVDLATAGGADNVVVSGTDANDTVAVSGAAGSIAVAGLATTVNIANADAATDTLTINGLAGDDVIDASGLAADAIRFATDSGDGNDVVIGSQGNDFVDGGRGNDLGLLGAGNDAFRWDPGDGNDTIEGQDGHDTMQFFGAAVGEQFDVSAIGGRIRFFRDIAAINMDLDDVEQIDLAALGGADRLVVNDVSGTDLVTVNTDLAVDGQADAVVVNATNGDDVVLATGSAGQVSVFGLTATVNITGAEATLDRLTVNALAGDDVIEGTGLAASAIALVGDGGAGDDVVFGGEGDDVLLGGSGDDVLIGGPGTDVLDGGDGDNIIIQ